MHADFNEIARHIEHLEQDFAGLLTAAHCLGHGCHCETVADQQPTSIQLTVQ